MAGGPAITEEAELVILTPCALNRPTCPRPGSRWGDAPVHTLAAGLLLDRRQIHFFNNIGYRHDGVQHCPPQEQYRPLCDCDPELDVHQKLWGCLRPFARVLGLSYEL